MSRPVRTRLDGVRRGRIAVGVTTLVIAAGYLVTALGMSLGSPVRPGPGVFPIGVGVVAIGAAILVIIEALFGRQEMEKVEWPRGEKLKALVLFFAATTAYVVALPFLGQYISSALYLSGMLLFLGRIRWWVALLIGVVVAVAISYVFTEWLDVNLPSGMW